MLRDSVVVVRARPRAIPLAMISMRKILHGFPFLSHDAYGAPLLIIFIIFWGVVRRGVRTGSPWTGP